MRSRSASHIHTSTLGMYDMIGGTVTCMMDDWLALRYRESSRHFAVEQRQVSQSKQVSVLVLYVHASIDSGYNQQGWINKTIMISNIQSDGHSLSKIKGSPPLDLL